MGDVTGIIEYQHNANNGLKVKLNDKLNLAFVLKHIESNQLAVSIGASMPLGSTFKTATKVGVQIDINV